MTVAISLETFQLQVNDYLHLQANDYNKPDKDRVREYNHSRFWETKEWTIDQIKDYQLSGGCIRLCVVSNDNSLQDGDPITGFLLDLDKEGANHLETLDNPLTQLAYLGYFSPSQKCRPEGDEYSKHRLCFLFDQPIGAIETAKEVIRYFEYRYGYAANLNVNQLYFGSQVSVEPFWNPSSDQTRKVNPFEALDMIQNDTGYQSWKETGEYEIEFDEPNETTLNINQLFVQECVGNSPIYILFDHASPESWYHRPDNIKGNVVDSWEGPPPRRTSESGRSFVIALLDNGEIVWNDRSNSKEISGSYWDYHYYRVNKFNDRRSKIPKKYHGMWIDFVEANFRKFNKLDVFKKHQQNYKNESIGDELETEIRNRIKTQETDEDTEQLPSHAKMVQMWRDELETEGRILYSPVDGKVWFYSDNIWKAINYRQAKSMFQLWLRETFNKEVGTKALYDQFSMDYTNLSPEYILKEPFEYNSDLYPFRNCLFSISKKETYEYSPEYKNVMVSDYIYSSEYTEPECILEFLEIVLGDSLKADKLVKLMVLSCQLKLIATGKAVTLQGTSGSGKSSIARIINKLLNPKHLEGSKLTLSRLCSDDRFYAARLDNLMLNWFEDVTGTIRNPETFKNLCVGEFDWNRTHVLVDADIKGIQGNHKAVATGQTWITCEANFWYNPLSKGGEHRRDYIFEFKNKSPRAKEIVDTYFHDSGWLNNFLLWALHQDGRAIFDEFSKEGDDPSWMAEIRLENTIDSNITTRFIRYRIEFTNNPEHIVSSQELWIKFDAWASASDKNAKIKKTVFEKDFPRRLNDYYRGWQLENKRQITSGPNKNRIGYFGIKLLEEDREY